MKKDDPRHRHRGPRDDHIASSQRTATALARLHPADRARVLQCVAERRSLAVLMAEPGTLAEAP